jgi:hypothetical protein
MNHTQLLNYLADKYNLQSYLEIGVQDVRNNFDRIRCPVKIGVDPCLPMLTLSNSMGHESALVGKTSDDFFSVKAGPFDLIFIDGYHESSQVERDFNNSLKCLNDGGFIVIHDCLPEKEETTRVPRDSKVWHGDVYKFVMGLSNYDGIRFITLNSDNGCCIAWKDKSSTPNILKVPQNWENYKLIGKPIMNVIQVNELDNYLPRVKVPV